MPTVYGEAAAKRCCGCGIFYQECIESVGKLVSITSGKYDLYRETKQSERELKLCIRTITPDGPTSLAALVRRAHDSLADATCAHKLRFVHLDRQSLSMGSASVPGQMRVGQWKDLTMRSQPISHVRAQAPQPHAQSARFAHTRCQDLRLAT
eukprot:COSAG02_NODE_2150_length_9660_cov_45.377889_4_plen_152_part_00